MKNKSKKTWLLMTAIVLANVSCASVEKAKEEEIAVRVAKELKAYPAYLKRGDYAPFDGYLFDNNDTEVLLIQAESCLDKH